MLKPYPFQEIGISFLARRREALLADDMGLGKTLQIVEAIKRLKLTNGVILCPVSIRRTWYRWLRDQYPGAFVKEITSANSVIDFNSFNVINYDIIWKQQIVEQIRQKEDWDILVCDESHYLKTHDSKRTKAVFGQRGINKSFRYRWAATGTPILNRPIEIFPLLKAFVPELLMQYNDYYKFAYKFCAGYNGPFGFDANGASNLDRLAGLISPFMLRRLKKDVLKDLPEAVYEKVYLDPTDKLRHLCDEEAKAKVTETQSLRHAIGLLKVKPAIAHIKTLLEERNKLVVFAWHTEVIHQIKEAFKNEAVIYT